jgi:hypothetical protein
MKTSFENSFVHCIDKLDMKKLIILLLLVSGVASAQEQEYKYKYFKSNNPTSSVQGKGIKFRSTVKVNLGTIIVFYEDKIISGTGQSEFRGASSFSGRNARANNYSLNNSVNFNGFNDTPRKLLYDGSFAGAYFLRNNEGKVVITKKYYHYRNLDGSVEFTLYNK